MLLMVKNKIKFYSGIFFSLFLGMLFLGVIEGLAQSGGTVTFRCPTSAPNTRLFKRVIQATVLQNVDLTTYSDIRVRVNLRSVGPGTQEFDTATFSSILEGLTLTQTGLVASASGALSFSSTCTYPYIARIRVIATDIETSFRLSSSNDSPIEITAPVEKRIRRFRPEVSS